MFTIPVNKFLECCKVQNTQGWDNDSENVYVSTGVSLLEKQN